MNKIKKIKLFLMEVNIEINKIIFPTVNNIKGYLISVIIVVSIMTLYISVIDFFLNKFIKYILGN